MNNQTKNQKRKQASGKDAKTHKVTLIIILIIKIYNI